MERHSDRSVLRSGALAYRGWLAVVVLLCPLGCTPRDPLWFHRLAADGDVPGIERALRRGADVDDRSGEGLTPLMLAATYDHADAARVLLSAGTDPRAVDYEGSTALHWAAMGGVSPEMVQALLDAGVPIDAVADDGATPLTLAAMAGYTETMRCLLSHGANCHGPPGERRTPLLSAARHSADTTMLLLGADPGGWAPQELAAPFRRAATFDRADTIEALLRAGAPIDSQDGPTGGTALHAAVGENACNAIRVLLDHNADTQVRDRKGRTPLDLAKEIGSTEAAELLEARGTGSRRR